MSLSRGEKALAVLGVLSGVFVFSVDRIFIPVIELNGRLTQIEGKLRRIENNQNEFMGQPRRE